MSFALGAVLGIFGMAVCEGEFQKAILAHRDLLDLIPEGVGVKTIYAFFMS